MPETTFIVVNWNGKTFLADCLNALLSQTCKDFEIILVDNGSIDDSVSFLKEHYPSIRLIELDNNSGFTGGNIAGLKQARGKFIALVNNDAILHSDWLLNMVKALENDKKLGCCASKIIISGTTQIDSIGDIFTSAFTGTKEGEYEFEQKFNQIRRVSGVCAAAAIYRKSMLDEIGFLDEDFFLNHEDTDLNMRIWLSGWGCLYIPNAVAVHQVNRSIGTMSDTSVYHFVRNNVWTWIKNTPSRFLFTHLPQRILYEVSSFAFFCLIHHKWKPYMMGKIHALYGLPKMIRKRKNVQKLVKLSNQRIRAELYPISAYLKHKFVANFPQKR